MDEHETWMRNARCARFPHLGWIKDRHQVGIGETATMAVCCARCPVFFDCESFASREDIVGGFWAGEHRDPPDLAFGGAA